MVPLDVFEQTQANIADPDQGDPKGAVLSVSASVLAQKY